MVEGTVEGTGERKGAFLGSRRWMVEVTTACMGVREVVYLGSRR
jgi:hypothetical protein